MCGIFGVLRKPSAGPILGRVALDAMESARHRGSGLGGGFARASAPRGSWTLRAFVDSPERASEVAAALDEEGFARANDGALTRGATLPSWSVEATRIPDQPRRAIDRVNARFLDGETLRARVVQCARGLDVWKDVAHPSDVAAAHALAPLAGDAWIAHTREPTNSPGRYPIWSHPFAAGEVAIVHNGDISSHGANLRFLRRQGYGSFTGTDSEAIAILLNHLLDERGLSPEDAARALLGASDDVDLAGAALDGPFAVVATWSTRAETLLLVMLDRVKLRPVVLGEDDDAWFVASEESQIRAVSPRARVWTPAPGRFALFSSARGALDRGRDAGPHARAGSGRGERFAAMGLAAGARMEIAGPTGNCVANLLDGGEVRVRGNVADDAADTMLSGSLVVRGDARDVLAQAMQGGRVLVRGDAGNRAGIQMREFEDREPPALVIGGRADAFLGESMAGGSIVVLDLVEGDDGLEPARDGGRVVGRHVGSGMVGGAIYVRGDVPDEDVGLPPNEEDVRAYLDALVLDGAIDDATRASAARERDPARLRALLPREAHGVLRLHEGKYHRPPRVERRALADDDLARIGPALQAFCEENALRPATRELVLSSRWTIVTAS